MQHRPEGIASQFSAALLVAAGSRQPSGAAAPVNATSQWLWGQREALRAHEPDGRHMLAGYLVHHAAVTAGLAA